jgi:hypothetical protein
MVIHRPNDEGSTPLLTLLAIPQAGPSPINGCSEPPFASSLIAFNNLRGACVIKLNTLHIHPSPFSLCVLGRRQKWSLKNRTVLSKIKIGIDAQIWNNQLFRFRLCWTDAFLKRVSCMKILLLVFCSLPIKLNTGWRRLTRHMFTSLCLFRRVRD